MQNCNFFSYMVSICLMFLGFLGTDSSCGLFSCHQNFMLTWKSWGRPVGRCMESWGLVDSKKRGKMQLNIKFFNASHAVLTARSWKLLQGLAISTETSTLLSFKKQLKGRVVCCCHPLLIAAFCVFSKVALQRSSGLDETGNIVWYLALCLLLSWMIVGAALFKGIKSSGKVRGRASSSLLAWSCSSNVSWTQGRLAQGSMQL